jgi:hypothetical protein
VLNYSDFRRTYLWGNRGAQKHEPYKFTYRLRRNAQLILNLDDNLKFLGFNEKFSLRLNLKQADRFLMNGGNYDPTQLKSAVLSSMKLLRIKEKK